MSDSYDHYYDPNDEYQNDEPSLRQIVEHNRRLMPLIKEYQERIREMTKNSTKKYEANKFYVGSNSVMNKDWGHPTLNKAIEHAKELMEKQNSDEIFIVKIVKVVRRKETPIEVIDVK